MEELTIEQIHESLVNGQRKQMVKQINAYEPAQFWPDYINYLNELYSMETAYGFLKDAIVSYSRITGR